MGDTFIFDNGATATVSLVWPDDDKVTWRTGSGRTRIATRNFVLPDLQWTTRRRNGSFEAVADLNELWPLVTGNSASTDGLATRNDERDGTVTQANQRFICDVPGTRSVTVAAGTFDTVEIRCRRFSKRAGRRTSIRILRWFYAPDIGHFVLQTRETLRGRLVSRTELAAVRRSYNGLATAQREAIAALRDEALSTLRSGETIRLAGDSVSAAVMMLSTFRSGSGGFCRRFVEKVGRGATTVTAPGIACREIDGDWQRL